MSARRLLDTSGGPGRNSRDEDDEAADDQRPLSEQSLPIEARSSRLLLLAAPALLLR
jgi:hypothetical protein